MRIEIIIGADEPALFFSSVRTAERALEWIDVRNGVYTAVYGRAGEVYEISEDGRFVQIRPTHAEPRPAQLRALLMTFLTVVRRTPTADENLDQLLERCEFYCRE